ncbi:MAG: hypothetical protein M3O15_07770 [Acidobacteriota bacterium]|nr:hypothetical protein [Acidobacteriota bacterium]
MKKSASRLRLHRETVLRLSSGGGNFLTQQETVIDRGPGLGTGLTEIPCNIPVVTDPFGTCGTCAACG